MVSKIEPDRYADTGFSLADTPADLNAHLFKKMMEKSVVERLIIGSQMTGTFSPTGLVISEDLPEGQRGEMFIERFYGMKPDFLPEVCLKNVS